MQRKPPDFFIVGAPKTGTTSLFVYLEQHDGIFFPKDKKEPMFFCGYQPEFTGPGSASLNKSMVVSEDVYEALYAGAPDHTLKGDASTDYLSCPKAVENIQKWNPEARIIIMLRNPVYRAYSEHMHLVRDQFEKNTFMESLELEEERRKRGYIPLFWHKGRGLYHESVSRYLKAFGKDQVRIILHEDFSADPIKITREVFDFLGLNPIDVDVSGKYNVSGVAKWPWLQKCYMYFRASEEQGWMKRLARVLTSGAMRQRFRVFYLRKNIKKTSGPTLDEEQYLRQYFANDVKQLSSLLGRDLSHWLRAPEQ